MRMNNRDDSSCFLKANGLQPQTSFSFHEFFPISTRMILPKTVKVGDGRNKHQSETKERHCGPMRRRDGEHHARHGGTPYP